MVKEAGSDFVPYVAGGGAIIVAALVLYRSLAGGGHAPDRIAAAG